MSSEFSHNVTSDLILVDNASLLLRTLYERGATNIENAMTGKQIKDAHNWDSESLEKVKKFLLERNRIGVGQGQGGQFWRKPVINFNENHYYDPIIHQLELWVKSHDSKDIPIETFGCGVNNSGRSNTGIWENPDAVVYRLVKYKYFPGRNLEAISFEIKAKSGLDKKAVYEAVAHHSFHNTSYVILVLPDYISPYATGTMINTEKFKEIVETCKQTGIGLIVVIEPDDYESWKTIVQPEIHFPHPSVISQNIARLKLQDKDNTKKARLGEWCEG